MPAPAPPMPSGGGVLDAQALARLHELDPSGQTGLVARVLATYAASLQRGLEQFLAARDAGDAQAIRMVAHTLKSSSASVGALKLSGLCADAERSLREGGRDDLAILLDELAAEGAHVLAAVQAPTSPGP